MSQTGSTMLTLMLMSFNSNRSDLKIALHGMLRCGVTAEVRRPDQGDDLAGPLAPEMRQDRVGDLHGPPEIGLERLADGV